MFERWFTASGATMIALTLVVSGCVTTPSHQQTQTSGPIPKGVIALNVANIDIVDQYRPPQAKPNVDHLVPIPPIRAVHDWATGRLRAVGTGGSVQVIILDASIVEVQLPKTQGIKGWFTTDQSQRYDGRIEVKVVGAEGGFSGYAQAAASRSITVPEDISLAGREDTWTTLVAQMVEDLDNRLEPGIKDGLGPLLRR